MAIPASAVENDSVFSLKCVAPDTRNDSTPLAPSELGNECHIYVKVDGVQQPGVIAAPWGFDTPYTINLVPKATPYSVVFIAYVVDKDGVESALSNEFVKAYIVQSDAAVLVSTLIVSITSCDGCTITEQ